MLAKKAERLNFSSIKNRTEYPDFLDIQIKSFQDFFQLETKSEERGDEGLYNTFMENFPITDTRNQFVLEFLDYFIDPPRYSLEECIERGLTYSVPLKARLKLFCTDPEHEDFETIVQDVYLRYNSLHDTKWYVLYQWCRTCCCIATYTVLQVFSLDNLSMLTVQNYILQELFLLKGLGLNLLPISIALCTLISIERKNYL